LCSWSGTTTPFRPWMDNPSNINSGDCTIASRCQANEGHALSVQNQRATESFQKYPSQSVRTGKLAPASTDNRLSVPAYPEDLKPLLHRALSVAVRTGGLNCVILQFSFDPVPAQSG